MPGFQTAEALWAGVVVHVRQRDAGGFRDGMSVLWCDRFDAVADEFTDDFLGAISQLTRGCRIGSVPLPQRPLSFGRRHIDITFEGRLKPGSSLSELKCFYEVDNFVAPEGLDADHYSGNMS